MSMFGRFCEWLAAEAKNLKTLVHDDIGRFLDTPNPNLPAGRRRAQTTRQRQRQQYVRMLERVFAHLESLGYAGANVGSQAGRARIGAGQDERTRFLGAEESAAVIALLDARVEALGREGTSPAQWMVYRDVALVAVMLGAGLKVGQVQRLTLNCIDLPEARIDLSRISQAHRARILPFAVAPIQAWLSVQRELHGGHVAPAQKTFEADRSSGFGRHSAPTLAASSIHRRTQRLLALAGVTGERASAQTLRNTYAGLLIEGGATDEHLVDCLGLQASVSAQRLRAALLESRPHAVQPAAPKTQDCP